MKGSFIQVVIHSWIRRAKSGIVIMLGTFPWISLLSRYRCSQWLIRHPLSFHCVRTAPSINHYSTSEIQADLSNLQKYKFMRNKRSETEDVKRARLIYESRKRGNLENGILLSTFADEHLDRFNSEQLSDYDALINLPDNEWDIYYWATGAQPVPEMFRTEVFEMLREFVKNRGMKARNHQPPLKPRSKS
ncbi:unnamed protein product [Calicophoron daubneyi]|uniref:Succinate dehydrogenase assembly factor 2, mitochondrial n=1 Tax=Calicophoron daubneyi TaxID=300641 RepID=A0AAV2THK7_CALDB